MRSYQYYEINFIPTPGPGGKLSAYCFNFLNVFSYTGEEYGSSCESKKHISNMYPFLKTMT